MLTRKLYCLVVLSTLLFGAVKGQNAIVGDGFTANWGGPCVSAESYAFLLPSAGTSYIGTFNANTTGVKYFRFGVNWGGIISQLTITPGSNTPITPGVPYELDPICVDGGALWLNVANTSDNYVFKTKDAGPTPTGNFVIFRIQGIVRSVTSVSVPPVIVSSGQPTIITAGLSGSFSSGQGAYLRYTTDGWSSSVVIPMTGSGTSYSAFIPSSANIPGANIEYYAFTSGSDLTISGSDADLFTINHKINGAENYEYEVIAADETGFFLFDDFQRTNYGDDVGIPSSNPGSPWLEYETTSSGARTHGGGLYLGSTTSGQDMISFDMSNHYPIAFDASSEEINWAFNMSINIIDPSGFNDNNRGAAFILGCNKSNFTDSDAFGYAVVLGKSGTPDHLRLVRFEDGLKLNSNLTEIVSVPNVSANSYFSINVSYNSCTQTWNLLVREEGEFTQPNLGPYPLLATASDGTYTSSDLPHLGALWNHSTGASPEMRIDNIYIPSPTIGSDVEYTWAGGASGNFSTATNWIPVRDCARNRDKLIFDGGVYEVTDVPNQNIGQLIIKNNANVTLRNIITGSISTLSLTGGEGDDLIIESGSVLHLDVRTSAGGQGIVLDMLAGATGEISGTLCFNNTKAATGGQHHQLLVTDTDALHIKSGGRVDAIRLLNSNNPFGDDRGYNAVVFESGSTYIHGSGANPYGYNRPNSKVIFEAGSWYYFTYSGGLPVMSGRTYANFKYDVNSTKVMGGSHDYFIDTLIVTQGSITFEHEAIGTIAGDIEVASGASLNFKPPTAKFSAIVIDAPAIQSIKGGGVLVFDQRATLNLQNHNRINIQKDITITGTGPANVLAEAVVAFEGENKFTGTGTTNVQNNSTIYIGSMGGIASSGLTGNICTASRIYSPQAAYVYAGTSNQITGTGLPVTLTGNGSLEIDNPDHTVTLTSNNTSTPKLTLTSGLFAVGASQTLAIANGGEIFSTNTSNFAAGNLAGTVEFKGAGIVSAEGDLDFWNVDLPISANLVGVNFGETGTPTIHNELIISNNRFVDENGPFYADGSTLVYNTGNEFDAGTEWYAALDTDGRGIPHNVQIGKMGVANSKLRFGPESGYRYCTGDVRIGHGSQEGYRLDLGGGNLKLSGDFLLNLGGQFTPNDKVVFFVGSDDQTIIGNTPEHEVTFNYMVVEKTGGDLLLSNTPGTTVNVNGAIGNQGKVLELLGGDLDLQGQTFNFGGVDDLLSFLQVGDSPRTVKSATSASFNVFSDKEVRSNGGALLFDDSVTVSISKGMNFGAAGISTINGTLQIKPNGFANINAPRYGPLGILKYNTGNVYLRRVEWNDNVHGAPGYPNDVIVAGGTELRPGGDNNGEHTNTPLEANRDVIIEFGSKLYMDYESDDMTTPLVVGRDLKIYGELSASDEMSGDVHVGGNWLRSSTGVFNPRDRQVLFNGTTAQTITADGGEVFDYLGFKGVGTKDFLDNITVNKNIDFYADTGPLSGYGKTIHLKGDWNNNAGQAAFTEAGTTVSFEGTSLQEVNCEEGDSEGFDNLKMNNVAGIKLNNNIRISGELEFVDGLIDAKVNRVDFELNSSHTGASQDSYINGFAKKIGLTENAEFLFPVGDYRSLNSGDSIIDVYQPAALIPNATNIAAAFTVDYNHDNYFPGYTLPNNPPPMDPLTLESVSTCNYWNIEPNSVSIGAKVRLYWTDACFDITEPENLLVAKAFDAGNDEEIWKSVGGPTTNSPFNPIGGYVETSIALTSFSPFTIGTTGGINVLPIELLSFTASPKGQVVETHWVTSTEINNEYFTVERSIDAIAFSEIGRVEGAGNSTTALSYTFIDDAPYSGISYYRLKQTDFDGATTYSDIRSVRMDPDSKFTLINVYRSDNGVNLTYRSDVETLKAEVFDLLGKRLFTAPIYNTNGQSTIRPSLVRGIYLLRLSNGVEVVSGKFFY